MSNFKKTIFYWLEDEDNPKLWISSTILIVLVLASVVLILIEETILHPSDHLHELNNIFIVIFGLEYLARLYCIDLKFKNEYESASEIKLKDHIKLRLRWMVHPLSLIDLVSLMPNVRVFRLLRILRAFKLYRYMGSITIFLRGVKSGWVLYIVLSVVTFFIISFGSIAIFLAEHDATSADYDNYVHTLFHVLQIFGLAEITPKTVLGKMLSTGVLLYNMIFFGFIVSFVNQRMSRTMDEIKKGHLGKLSLKKHICILGYQKNTDYIIKDLIKNKLFMNKIVVLSENGGPDMNNVISVTGDFTDTKWLNYINVKEAETIIVMSEKSSDLTDKDVDLRSVLTLYKLNDIIHKHYDTNEEVAFTEHKPHIIVELLDQKYVKLINEIKLDSVEIILKEIIDALIINTAIQNKYSSFLFKKILGIDDEVLGENENSKNKNENRILIVPLNRILKNKKTKIETIKDLRMELVDSDINLLGVLTPKHEMKEEDHNPRIVHDSILDPNPVNSKKVKPEMEYIIYGKL